MPIPPLPLFRHRDTVVTPADQNQFVTQFETTMDTLSNNVIPAMNDSITDINEKVITATTARDESEDARDIAVAAKDEALTAVATLQEGAIDDTVIAPNKAFSNQHIENNYYDKTETYNKTEVDTAINNSSQINTLTDKPTPDNTDNFAIQEVGGDLKKVSFQNLTKLSPNDSRVKTALNASGTAPIYACRAWVNFNGQGTVAIRASGNVSSITDNGVGDYTVNFTTAMPDKFFSTSLSCAEDYTNNRAGYITGDRARFDVTTSSVRVWSFNPSSGARTDVIEYSVQIHR